jgi:hypothetical protein
MAMSPFSVPPSSPANAGRRARIVLVLAALGIAASLLAYAISPSVRHAVGHAAHSVGHALDRDAKPAVKKPAVKKPAVKKPAVKKPAVKKPATTPTGNAPATTPQTHGGQSTTPAAPG